MVRTNRKLSGRTACLLVDSECVTLWQYESLKKTIANGLEITLVILCENNAPPKRFIKNFAYYVLNLISIRHKWKALVKWQGLVSAATPCVRFKANWSGAWQSIPPDVTGIIKDHNVDFIIKFGMYLLRDPNDLPANFGVVSYHHGDPSQYRGRPAGFYELLDSADHIGVIVQRLNNKLDGGDILAYGSSKVYLHSYKKTLENAYGQGVHLLLKGLVAAVRGQNIELRTEGKNCRLPKNWVVIKFFFLIFSRKIKRLFYGLFIEKAWGIFSTTSIAITPTNDVVCIEPASGPSLDPNYSFVADPMAFDTNTFLCEAMNKSTGLGEIVAITDSRLEKVDLSSLGRGHFSYPFIFSAIGKKYILPEMSSHSSQKIAEISESYEIVAMHELMGLERYRLVDPTLFHFNKKWWLFAGQKGAGSDLLFLWYSDNFLGNYLEHPSNPIVIDPRGARQAGPIIIIEGVLYRCGQDNTRDYGNGINLYRIEVLDSREYVESHALEIRMFGANGPHTICKFQDGFLVDYYYQRFNVLAWRTRLIGVASKLPRRLVHGF